MGVSVLSWVTCISRDRLQPHCSIVSRILQLIFPELLNEGDNQITVTLLQTRTHHLPGHASAAKRLHLFLVDRPAAKHPQDIIPASSAVLLDLSLAAVIQVRFKFLVCLPSIEKESST